MSERGRVVHVNDQVEGAVYVGRPNGRKRLKGSPLANGFAIGPTMTRAEAIDRYERWLTASLRSEAWKQLREELIAVRGKPLACWCRHDGEERTPDNECHADVLIEILERYTDDELRAFGEVR